MPQQQPGEPYFRISLDEAMGMLDERSSTVVDVRRPDEYLTGHVTNALFIPPTDSRMVLAAAAAWEQIGARWFHTFAGAVMIEASKQIYAAAPVAAPARRRRAYAVLPGAAVRETAPARTAGPPNPGV